MNHADRFSILTIWVFGWQLGEADWLLGSRQVHLWASSVQPHVAEQIATDLEWGVGHTSIETQG